MSVWRKAIGRLAAKALSQMQFPGRTFIWFDFPKVEANQMAQDIGDGTSSDIVMTPVRWLQRAFNEAQLIVREEDEIADRHPLPVLIRNPNPFYSSEHLYAGTLYSLCTDGNAYWIKVRNGNGEVRELWWAPHQVIEPKWPDRSDVFISHYVYKVAGKEILLEVDDVVHFRDGVDPQNMRKGLSPLRGLLREIWTDNEAAVFTAALMRNGGVPGLILSPKSVEHTITADEAEAAKARIDTEFAGERRGRMIVMTGPTDLQQFGFNPQQLDMSALRNVSEERVTAALGVPAAVAGFGAGLQQTKVGATMRELRQLAWHNGVIPLQRIIAGAVQRSLLPEFGETGQVEFSNSDVAALADDQDKFVERVARLVTAAIWTRGEGREATGQQADPADDVYLMPINVIEVPRGERDQNIDPEERGLLHYQRKADSLLERDLAASARRARPSARIERFAATIDAIRRRLPDAMEPELLAFFAQLGAETTAAALAVIEDSRSASAPQTKRNPMDAERIAAGIEWLRHERLLGQLYERHYLRVGNEVGGELAKFLGLEAGLPDPAARALMATGGRRAGLLDLTAKSKRAIFRSLVEGRIEGLAGENLARFIREGVEAGPWSSAKIRARVIARTETAFATNVAVIEGAGSMTGVEQAMVHDGRAGETDALCESLNGVVVTLEQARQLAADEHPNGTRSFTPLTPQLLEELGL